jgi:hypothetical protein
MYRSEIERVREQSRPNEGTFGSKRKEVTKGWRKLRDKNVYNCRPTLQKYW